MKMSPNIITMTSFSSTDHQFLFARQDENERVTLDFVDKATFMFNEFINEEINLMNVFLQIRQDVPWWCFEREMLELEIQFASFFRDVLQFYCDKICACHFSPSLCRMHIKQCIDAVLREFHSHSQYLFNQFHAKHTELRAQYVLM